jgi:hypothetical protein
VVVIKKYLVYISSAGDDLKNERRELVKIVTELGAVPVVMDAFAMDDAGEQTFIKKAVEECDYFLNLTAHKAGESTGKSLALEQEFTWAEQADVPVVSLIIDDKARWKDSRKDKNPAAIKALKSLKNRLREHTFATWTNQADLCQKARSLLIREMRLNPRQGWVPAGDAVEPGLANEFARLLRENGTLKEKLKTRDDGSGFRIREQMKHALKVMSANKLSLSFWYIPGDNWENTRNFRYLRLFKLLSPELTLSKTTADISRFLGNILNPDLGKTVRKDYPTPTNTIKKLMADLLLLKLVRATGTGDDEAWEMTAFGRETYAAYRIRQLERGVDRLKQEKSEQGKR